GLFLYDHLSTRTTLPGSESVRLNGQSPLKSCFKQGFEYSDAWVDDARLVVLNAMALKERGGTVLTRTRAVSAVRDGEVWHIHLKDQLSGEERVVQARALVNAAGPWVTEFIHGRLNKQSSHNVRLIKGSHIIVPALYHENRAYILQNDDQRIVFVIPYMEQFSLIGTTDVEYTGDPASVHCSQEERRYLCRVVNQHFKKDISVEDIVWDYSGVRPLCEDESSDPRAVTRDYTFEIEDDQGKAPLLSIFGGKLTTYRKLAEHAMNRLACYFPEAGEAWTSHNRLPGAEIPARCIQQLKSHYPWLPEALAGRYCHSYGSLSYRILSNADSIEGLGRCFGAGLYQAEVDYLLRYEWVMEEEDLLWRRTKLGLFLTEPEKKELGSYIKQRLAFILD
ncbi:MAG: glycerol-3-phosphate dehydrogenase, partial [Endozoicomonas sp.]